MYKNTYRKVVAVFCMSILMSGAGVRSLNAAQQVTLGKKTLISLSQNLNTISVPITNCVKEKKCTAGNAPVISFVSINQNPYALCGNAGGGNGGSEGFLSYYVPNELEVSLDDCVISVDGIASAIDDAGTFVVQDVEDGVIPSINVTKTFGAHIEYAPGNGQFFVSYNTLANASSYIVYAQQHRVCRNYYTPVTYTVTDSDGNSSSNTRNLIYCNYSGYQID